MMTRGRLGTIAALGALGLALVLAGGCRTMSNLQDRPEWAKSAGAELPASHPRSAEFPSSKYMTIVVEGTGQTIENARAAAEGAAQRAFGEQILAQVGSQYETQSQTAISGSEESGTTEMMKEQVRQSIKVASTQFLSSVRAISTWDEGFVIDPQTNLKTHYVYGAYVLDRDVAAKQAAAIARRNVTDLEAIASAPLHEQAAKDAIRKLFELEIVSNAANFFGRPAAAFPGAADLKRKCQNFILDAGEARVKSGNVREIEEALSLYEYCAVYDQGGVWPGRIIACKRLLPCLNCAGTGVCPACQGQKGQRIDCPVCHGSTRVLEPCSACDGTGEMKCAKCNGKKTVPQTCNNPKCKNGKEPCAKCGGTGQIVERCGRCNGSGRLPMGAACPDCRGSGKIARPCRTSSNLLDQLAGDRGCNGTGWQICHVCGGDRVMEAACPECGGTGRHGTCPRCSGAGRIEVKCRNCQDGTKWVACPTCNGTGVCAVCKGRKTRN